MTDTRVLLTIRWYTTPITSFTMRRRLSLALGRAKSRARHR